MAVMHLNNNMGKADRILRGVLGGVMLLDGMSHRHGAVAMLRRLEALTGSAFVLYGLTGFDPLLKMFGASTVPGAENNILNLAKQAAPGQGINPMLTQQPLPKKPVRGINPEKPIADALVIP